MDKKHFTHTHTHTILLRERKFKCLFKFDRVLFKNKSISLSIIKSRTATKNIRKNYSAAEDWQMTIFQKC